jgi:glycogen debranching enzyme
MARHIPLTRPEDCLGREWLTTNGLGGYASGTLAGPPIRRWHGWLVAALPAPLGKVVLVSHLDEALESGEVFRPIAFSLESGLPVWVLQAGATTLQRRLLMPHGANTALVEWRRLDGPAAGLVLTPWLNPRPVGTPVDHPLGQAVCEAGSDHLCLRVGAMPALHVGFGAGRFAAGPAIRDCDYPNEADGEDPSHGTLWSPGTLHLPLDGPVTVTLSTTLEAPPFAAAWDREIARRRAVVAAAHPALRQGAAADLVLAADSFVVEPQDRPTGPGARTVMAGYHWFGDWGRDTMISLEGLTLVTGRADDARRILLMFADFVQDGLIPNMFPDGAGQGVYHTADATLWFFHAVDRYWRHTGDDVTLARLLPLMDDIERHHRHGTRFGIAVDPADGLLRQGEAGWQLTWMDAKADDWVVTPRCGKAVEINALWFNALGALADWREHLGHECSALRTEAARVKDSFNARFWAPELGHLYDVVDATDGAFRPNQLFALSLPRPVLSPDHWPAVATAVRTRLLTPRGLRSLSADSPLYQPRYFGNRVARDGAYHQGTVWAWLLGAFADAWLAAFPDDPEPARCALEAILPHLDEYGIGSLGEIFDAEAPHTARGCISQAWSVAEWLRAWTRLEGGIGDRPPSRVVQ